LIIDGNLISSGTPQIHLNAKTEDKDVSATYRLKIPSIMIDNKTAILTMASVTAVGLYKGPYKEPEKGKVSFSLKVSDIGINSGPISANATKMDIKGTMARDPKGNLSVTGDLSFSGAGISVQGQGTKVGGISGDVPFQWPFNADGRPGNIKVGSIRLKDLELGEIETAILQENNGFIFNGKYTSRLLPDLVMELSGTAGFAGEDKGALINISLPDYRVPPDTDLKIINPGLNNIFFEGLVTLTAGISFSEAGPRGKMRMGIKEAQIKAAGNELVLDGISGELNFTDIFSLRSAPKQSLKVSKISFRDLKADNLMTDFQIESKESIFIEQCRFNWCQGHVNIQSFRFFPGINDYGITLNCDRLNLADIMEQFGVAKATGTGAVNGSIPITLSKGQFTFGDGFLYSTPGDGGNIHVSATEALTAGLPTDSDQYMQMQIAREALKDFEYDWAKLSLSTEDADMVMKLQFDGKPANALPFVYNKDIGKFIKLETGARGSVFQGISLDINFRVPLNEILKYNNILF
ncbi:MAG: YdbH domain-containing protein, partial [Deltaproteobacteria bacterium]|nr:YdbH domain-containing protein [Deltaproteobacteria bacterium]